MFEQYDVAVAGGGLSGIRAALAAARMGARTLLIEKRSSLGGQMLRRLDFTLAGEAPENAPPVSAMDPMERARLWRQELTCAGVQVLTDAQVFAADLRDGTVGSVSVLTCEGVTDVSARVWVDATGVGALAHACHVPGRTGRESDGQTLPPTFTFLAQGAAAMLTDPAAILREARRACPALLDMAWETVSPEGMLRVTLSAALCPYGLCALDASRAEALLRDMVDPVMDVLRAAGLWDGAVVRTAEGAYFPEGRHVEGRHCLDAEEFARGVFHPDAVAVFGGASVPYRAMLPLRIKNLLLTGRTVSGTQDTLLRTGAPRISMALGEAAGIAAALCLECGARPRRVTADAILSARDGLRRRYPHAAPAAPAACPAPPLPPLPVEGDLSAALAGLLDDVPAAPAPPIPAPEPAPAPAPEPAVIPEPVPVSAAPAPREDFPLWDALAEAADEALPFYIPKEMPPWL